MDGCLIVRLQKDGVDYVSAADAGFLLEVTSRQVRHLAAAGRVRSLRQGRMVYVSESDVRQYARDRRPWWPGGVYGGRRAAGAVVDSIRFGRPRGGSDVA